MYKNLVYAILETLTNGIATTVFMRSGPRFNNMMRGKYRNQYGLFIDFQALKNLGW
jgi:hypothetical protein